MRTELVEELPAVEVREGTIYWTTEDSRHAMRLPMYRRLRAREAKLIAAYESKLAEVVPITRGHAARS